MPVATLTDNIPLRNGSFKGDARKVEATRERRIADGGDGVTYRYARKKFVATKERTIVDGGD